MSTRATYQFVSPDFTITFYIHSDGYPDFTITFYIHSDGYPDGAASYFFAALTTEAKGTFAEKFFRGNPQAEFTSNHQAHWDTAYEYTVTLGETGQPLKIQAVKRSISEEYTIVYNGDLHDFINQNAKFVKEKVLCVASMFWSGGTTPKFLTTEKAELARIEALEAEYVGRLQKYGEDGTAKYLKTSTEMRKKNLAEALGNVLTP